MAKPRAKRRALSKKPPSQLGQTLCDLLREMHLSESELAQRAGIGQAVIHRICSGETCNPKVNTLLPLAQYFGLTIEALLLGKAALPPLDERRSLARLNEALTAVDRIQTDLLKVRQLIQDVYKSHTV